MQEDQEMRNDAVQQSKGKPAHGGVGLLYKEEVRILKATYVLIHSVLNTPSEYKIKRQS